jgi:S1 RNA binding domain
LHDLLSITDLAGQWAVDTAAMAATTDIIFAWPHLSPIATLSPHGYRLAGLALEVGPMCLPLQALIHKSELSWDRIMRPEQVVRPGDVVQCKVTSVDPEKARVTLSLKRMQVCIRARPCCAQHSSLLRHRDSTCAGVLLACALAPATSTTSVPVTADRPAPCPQSDPLKETLDGLLPMVEEGAEALGTVPTNVPQSIEEVRRQAAWPHHGSAVVPPECAPASGACLPRKHGRQHGAAPRVGLPQVSHRLLTMCLEGQTGVKWSMPCARAQERCGTLLTPARWACAWRQVASELEKEEGISAISMGRQVEERRTVAQARLSAHRSHRTQPTALWSTEICPCDCRVQ